MLSIGAMSQGQGSYYASLAREDYYLAGGEPPGVWRGTGAQKLGLSGLTDRQQFLEVFDGFKDGRALVQSAGHDKHRPGWDLTFSAPKSVSTAWSQADQETALEIRAAHLSAVEKATEYLEENALWTRRGKAGSQLERCGGVFATFEHGTSRAQDPQLHSHALLLNIAVREDGSTGTLETFLLYKHKMVAGALYRAELANQLERRLGLSAEREGSWFELNGVSETLTDEFSKRRQEIKEILAEKGFNSAKASEIAALDSRAVKEHVPREQLIEQWRAVGKEHGWSEEQLKALVRGPQPARDCELDLRRLAYQSVMKLAEKNSHFAERDLLRLMAEEAQTMGAGASAITKECKAFLENSPDVVRLGMRGNECRFTTKDMLRTERDLLDRVAESKGANWKAVDGETVFEVLAARPTIKDEQKKAVRHITRGEGSIACVTGMAGTGKTFMLEAAREALERGGYRVIGASLSGKAAQGLEEGSGIESSTIARLLLRLENGKESLNSKTVLVVDEAGMIGTRQMHALVTSTEKAGAKLVLVGDERQLQPIEAGGAFAAISNKVGTVLLQDIIRQKEDWQKKTVKGFAAGEASEALLAYAERGLVTVAKNREQAREELLKQWQESGGTKRPTENLIVASTNLDATTLNHEAQRLREEKGYLKEASIKAAGERFHVGDRILFTRNSAAVGVKNGSLGTVTGLNRLLQTLEVRLDNGEERKFSTWSYEHVKLGYAVTTHKAQGMTAENVFIITNESMQDRELSYVQASRAKGETRFFTTEAEAGEHLSDLSKTMSRSHQKDLAHDVSRDAGHDRDHDASMGGP